MCITYIQLYNTEYTYTILVYSTIQLHLNLFTVFKALKSKRSLSIVIGNDTLSKNIPIYYNGY